MHGENLTKSLDPSKELRLLLAFFGESQLPLCRQIAADEVPEPYHHLLVHDRHMTETLEGHYRRSLVVRPYQVRRDGDLYGRKLDLLTAGNSLVILTGIMLFNFRYCNERVRDLILEQRIPLGRILAENNVLRQISTESFLRLDAADPLVARFGLPAPRDAYGRVATIFCDERPAVDLLEIVRPE